MGGITLNACRLFQQTSKDLFQLILLSSLEDRQMGTIKGLGQQKQRLQDLTFNLNRGNQQLIFKELKHWEHR
jgi:hypothetical protein